MSKTIRIYNTQTTVKFIISKRKLQLRSSSKLLIKENWLIESSLFWLHFLLVSLVSLISNHQILHNRLLIKPQIKGKPTHHLADWEFNNSVTEIKKFLYFSFHTLSNAEIITSLYLWPGRKTSNSSQLTSQQIKF